MFSGFDLYAPLKTGLYSVSERYKLMILDNFIEFLSIQNTYSIVPFVETHISQRYQKVQFLKKFQDSPPKQIGVLIIILLFWICTEYCIKYPWISYLNNCQITAFSNYRNRE